MDFEKYTDVGDAIQMKTSGPDVAHIQTQNIKPMSRFYVRSKKSVIIDKGSFTILKLNDKGLDSMFFDLDKSKQVLTLVSPLTVETVTPTRLFIVYYPII